MANNRRVAYDFFRAKGLTPAQAAGVVGSLMQESGLNAKAKNPSSGAYGIGQWLGGRKTNLLKQGDLSLRGQLNFLWGELQGPEKAAFQRLRQAHTVADATAAFTWGFERPGKAEANMPNRIREARAALGLDSSAPTSSASTSKTTTTTTTPGQTTESTITSGGDLTRPQLPQRERPTVTGPQLPSYAAFGPTVQAAMPQIADRQQRDASLKDAIAKLTNVPVQETTETSTTPSQTTTETSGTSTAPSGGKGGSKVLELIFNDGGKGYGIKNGQTVQGSQVFSGVWGGHANHVHVAAGPKTVVALGKVAQKMGLNVGENPAFGGVDIGAHVPGSYHGKKEAIDVSGDKKLMSKFARYVADYNKTRTLPA